MLDCEVVRRSTVLTDKLLRLLSLVSLGLAEPNPNPNAPPMVENQVRLAVQVLTSKSCSEEGLEDTTALLLNLASYNDAMREMVIILWTIFFILITLFCHSATMQILPPFTDFKTAIGRSNETCLHCSRTYSFSDWGTINS